MIRINKYSTIQPANVETTETEAQPAATSQSQSDAVNNAPTQAVSSTNTWQRAGLVQGGIAQQTKLAQRYDHSKAEIAQAKEAREDSQSGALLGTIFGGPIIGTSIGNAVGTESRTETKKSALRDLLNTTEEEIKKLQEQLKEVQDNSFVETVGDWFVGNDAGQSKIAEATNQNPSKDLLMEAYTKVHHDPDDD